MLYLDLDNVMADFLKASKKVSGIEGYSPEVWEHIDKVPNFFYNLEVMEGAWYLLDYLDWQHIPYEFLTAMPKPTGFLYQAQSDKVRWVQRKLDSKAQVNAVSNWSMKKYFCREGDILVDDCERNIKDWESVGGIGILHTNFDDTIAKLKEVLE